MYMRTLSLLALTLPLALPVAAEVDGQQLRVFQQEFDAYNAERPEANRYRAGFYSGYLQGVLEALQGRSVCFKACRCELDDRVAQYLRDHPAELDRPAGPWLVKLLEAAYPCPK
jgi:hypothetical protein